MGVGREVEAEGRGTRHVLGSLVALTPPSPVWHHEDGTSHQLLPTGQEWSSFVTGACRAAALHTRCVRPEPGQLPIDHSLPRKLVPQK